MTIINHIKESLLYVIFGVLTYCGSLIINNKEVFFLMGLLVFTDTVLGIIVAIKGKKFKSGIFAFGLFFKAFFLVILLVIGFFIKQTFGVSVYNWFALILVIAETISIDENYKLLSGRSFLRVIINRFLTGISVIKEAKEKTKDLAELDNTDTK